MGLRDRAASGAPWRRGWRVADAWILAALLLAAAAYLWPLRPYGFMVNDDGWYLHPVLRMLGGEILYRDVWTWYAPLEHHLFVALFRLTGPSILAARGVWVVILLLGVAGSYLAARCLAPPRVAWIPAAVFALVPGQWSKGFYTLCTALFVLALAATLARASARRFALLGGMVGFALIARQDVGIAALGLALAAAALLALAPQRFGLAPQRRGRRTARWGAAFLCGAALPVLPVVACYARHAALGPLLDATLVRAFAQRQEWYGAGLRHMLAPESFLEVAEGRAVGALLLLPPLFYLGVGLVLLRRLLRHGLEREMLLVGALLLFAAAGLLNTLYQLRLLRLLETGASFYLLVAWAAAAGAEAMAARAGGAWRRAARSVPFATALLAGGYVALIVHGLPRVLLSDDYTGSARARRLEQPLQVLGETLYVDWVTAEEARLVRGFVEARVAPDEPVFAMPLISGYYLLLERPNPTRVVHVHFRKDSSLTDAAKHREVQRLLDSPTRYAVVMSAWLGWHEPPDPIRAALQRHFHPVREYGSLALLARNRAPDDRLLMRLYRRVTGGRLDPSLLEPLRESVRRRPEEPLPLLLLGRTLAALGQADAAVSALEAAARLEPGNPSPLEEAALLRIGQGRAREAGRELRRALAVRENPAARRLLAEVEAGAQ